MVESVKIVHVSPVKTQSMNQEHVFGVPELLILNRGVIAITGTSTLALKRLIVCLKWHSSAAEELSRADRESTVRNAASAGSMSLVNMFDSPVRNVCRRRQAELHWKM